MSIATPGSPRRERVPTVLCILDFLLSNLTMHYSVSKVLHPGQGLEEIVELFKAGLLSLNNIRLVYILAGRADSHLSPGEFVRRLEVLLNYLHSVSPRVMVLLAGLIIEPTDSGDIAVNITEVNQRISRIADKNPHWLYCNPNTVLALGGVPQKRFFNKDGFVLKSGCMNIAKFVVAASRGARMQKNFDVLPPWSPSV